MEFNFDAWVYKVLMYVFMEGIVLICGILLDDWVYKCLCVCLYTYGDGLGKGKCYLWDSTLMWGFISAYVCAYILMEMD